eukprot:Gb_17477 [translate_table: standard]
MDSNKVKPKWAASPLGVENQAKPKAYIPFYRRPILCSAITIGILCLIALLFVILAVTVFKTKNARITVNSVKLDDIHVSLDWLRLRVNLNVTLNMDLSVKNPNKASFKFTNSTTLLYYRGATVGQALIPAGKILADRTLNMTTKLTILADRLLTDSNLLSDARSGIFPLSTSTRISGRVNVLNVFKHHAVSYTFCNVSVFIWNQTIRNSECTYKTKL